VAQRQHRKTHDLSALEFLRLPLKLDARVKERLTGAIILVAVLVLLVPELLSGPEQYTMQSESAEGSAPLRSYTIDLADDASRRATPPTSAPAVATDDPVGAATPEYEVTERHESSAAEPDAGASVEGGAEAPVAASGPAAGDARSDQAARQDTSRDAGASKDATRVDGNAGRPASPNVEDDKPRSAFGPNAVQRPKPASDAPAAASARGGDATPSARSSSSGGTSSKDADSGAGRTASAETPRPAPKDAPVAKDAKVTKGWAVQLGVFASRDNADRLAKQVKGKGYTVSVNETSGNGKRLYRVRVGPEASRTAATELGAKLRAAGYTGSVVAWP
jgi:DedD protein